MAQVSISINGQHYTVTCDDGQEERLMELAEYFDSHVRNIAGHVGRIADSRLMLLAGLTVCDELKDTQLQLSQVQGETGLTSEDNAAEIIETATERVRNVTARLEESTGTS